MLAALLNNVNTALNVTELSTPKLQPGKALINLQAAALNRRDLWIQQGAYPKIEFPAVLGSDGSGVLAELNETDSLNSSLGDNVLICPSLNWGNNQAHQSPQFSILGMPSQGTLAEKICVPIENIVARPPHLSHQEAAALPLAGLTAWRSIFTKGQLAAGERVLITGIGGGVALMALQFAIAAGAEVFVTSSSEAKIKTAQSMGAAGGISYTVSNWRKQLPKSFDVIIDSAGGPDFGELIKLIVWAVVFAFSEEHVALGRPYHHNIYSLNKPLFWPAQWALLLNSKTCVTLSANTKSFLS